MFTGVMFLHPILEMRIPIPQRNYTTVRILFDAVRMGGNREKELSLDFTNVLFTLSANGSIELHSTKA